MMRASRVAVLAGGLVSLAGCLPMMAANVATTAVGVAVGRPQNNEGSGGTATQACVARAAPYGTVHLIDTEQHTSSMIIVWGTVQNAQGRKSFRCVYGTKIKSFTLKDLPAQR